MAYLDLDEVATAIDSLTLLSHRKIALASFRREDHLGHADKPLADAVCELVHDRTGMNLRGPVRLLTQLRYFGHYFSPLNLFFCFDPEGDAVNAIVAEVSNTPWREQHCYVLWEGNRTDPAGGLSFAHRKEFHVSPFMGMDAEYRWKLTLPDDQLMVRLCSLQRDEPFFGADMTLLRRPLADGQIARLLLRYPIMTARIVGAVYYQALKLWLKKCPFYLHPNKAAKLPLGPRI